MPILGGLQRTYTGVLGSVLSRVFCAALVLGWHNGIHATHHHHPESTGEHTLNFKIFAWETPFTGSGELQDPSPKVEHSQNLHLVPFLCSQALKA